MDRSVAELCEQAVQTLRRSGAASGDERPLTIGRLWESNKVHEPDTEFSVVVATDAKLEAILRSTRVRVARVADRCLHRRGPPRRRLDAVHPAPSVARRRRAPLGAAACRPVGDAVQGKRLRHEATKALAARFGGKRLAAFEDDAYAQLVKLGVLAKVRHEVLPGIDVELSIAAARLDHVKPPDRPEPVRADRPHQRRVCKVLVEHIIEQDPDWPILVFTPSVLSAQVLAASLRYRGVEAASVSGQTGRQERRDVIEQFQELATSGFWPTATC